MTPTKVFIAVLALVGAFILGSAAYAEVQSYRQMKQATAAMFTFLATEIGTRKGPDGKEAPISRADALAFVAEKELKLAASQSPTTPPSTK